jgi:hypothetical protein
LAAKSCSTLVNRKAFGEHDVLGDFSHRPPVGSRLEVPLLVSDALHRGEKLLPGIFQPLDRTLTLILGQRGVSPC